MMVRMDGGTDLMTCAMCRSSLKQGMMSATRGEESLFPMSSSARWSISRRLGLAPRDYVRLEERRHPSKEYSDRSLLAREKFIAKRAKRPLDSCRIGERSDRC